MDKLKSIKGVEIFSTGKWSGDTYTEADLDDMVHAYSELRDKWIPALKLGHTGDQKLLQADGLPAAGWVGNLYRKGSKLLADFVDIPEKVYQLIANRAYKNKSAEIYWGIDINGKRYNRLLGAVSLLGADMPALTNLDAIMAMYANRSSLKKCYATEAAGLIIKSYDHKESQMNEAELKEALAAKETEAVALAGEVKIYKADVEAKAAELETLRKYKAEAEAREIELAQKAAEAQLDAEVSGMVSEKLCTKAMKPYVRELLGAEKKEYSFKEGDQEKKMTKLELLKEVLKLYSAASAVNFDESSVVTEEQNEATDASRKEHEAIEKYAAENKVSYSQAARAILREKASKSA
jgi:hypothetical protein